MAVYYNEWDKDAADWLRDLIAAKLIPDGDVDERSITDIKADELRGYTQCHFFAGIGGWPLALRLAGVPESRRLWTGSCPCQPFSNAGKQQGTADERHLLPVWLNLIRESRPPELFGEQVESAIRHGWLDLLQGDLEREGYAVAAVVLGAHSVGAPHIRQRLYFVANTDFREPNPLRGDSSKVRGLPQAKCEPEYGSFISGRDSQSGDLEYSNLSGSSRQFGVGGKNSGAQRVFQRSDESVGTFWSSATPIWCRDEKYRPVEPRIFPLAYGLPRGMGAMPKDMEELARLAELTGKYLRDAKAHRKSSLKGYGNAIVPELAAEFVRAYLDIIGE